MRVFGICCGCDNLMVKMRDADIIETACCLAVAHREEYDFGEFVMFLDMQARNPGVDLAAEIARTDPEEVEDFDGRWLPPGCPMGDAHESASILRGL